MLYVFIVLAIALIFFLVWPYTVTILFGAIGLFFYSLYYRAEKKKMEKIK
jgi:hypothetical protein